MFERDENDILGLLLAKDLIFIDPEVGIGVILDIFNWDIFLYYICVYVCMCVCIADSIPEQSIIVGFIN